ncbi:MAG: sigma-70 family RNA polymerase sigma factor [Bacteroidota bacterium]
MIKRIIDPNDLKKVVRGSAKGNPEARKALYDMHAPQMLSVCYRYAQNREDAEEIFQQGFYLVYKNIGQLKDYKALSGWVKRIFVNAALQHNQQKQKLYPLSNWEDEGKELSEANAALSTLETVELTKLIRQLPRGCKEVFNLYVVEGYSHKEIAEMMGIAEGTSKSQLHDARKMLKAAIIKNNKEAVRRMG